jgi:glucose/mannose-6-phosphate isomerase
MLTGAGALSDPAQALLESANATESLLGSGEPGAGRDLAGSIATALEGRVPIIWGSAGPSEVAAQRWAKQINENAKLPAYYSTMPEIDHNELVGWGSAPAEVSRSAGIVILRDKGETAEISRRFDLTVELLRDQAPFVGEVWSSGESVLARAATAALMGDLVSVLMAEVAGVDPLPVDIITQLKNRL